MIQKKVICDRCEKVIFDSENKQEKTKATEFIDAMFGTAPTGEIGYVEMNLLRIDGKNTRTLHFCEECYDIAVNAWNNNEVKSSAKEE